LLRKNLLGDEKFLASVKAIMYGYEISQKRRKKKFSVGCPYREDLKKEAFSSDVYW
jgi:hypothetical protein